MRTFLQEIQPRLVGLAKDHALSVRVSLSFNLYDMITTHGHVFIISPVQTHRTRTTFVYIFFYL